MWSLLLIFGWISLIQTNSLIWTLTKCAMTEGVQITKDALYLLSRVVELLVVFTLNLYVHTQFKPLALPRAFQYACQFWLSDLTKLIYMHNSSHWHWIRLQFWLSDLIKLIYIHNSSHWRWIRLSILTFRPDKTDHGQFLCWTWMCKLFLACNELTLMLAISY